MPQFVDICCSKCGRHLATTFPEVEVYCPKCGRWTPGPLCRRKKQRRAARTVNARKDNSVTKNETGGMIHG